MRKLFLVLAVLTLAAPLMFYGCSGDDGSQGAQGIQGPPGPPGSDLVATAQPETCAVCHPGAGDAHQASYDRYYQDNVIQVTGVTYNFQDNNDVVTFTMTSTVDPALTCKTVSNLNIYFAPYDNTGRFEFNPAAARKSIKGTLVAGANGLCTSTSPSTDNVALGPDGVVIVYGYDKQLGSTAARVRQVAYPYAGLYTIGTVDYVSAANVNGCQKCHTVPYLKHGNIYGRVAGDPATDFITCKACHLDNNEGAHLIWQLLVDDPPTAAVVFNGTASTPGSEDADFMTPEQVVYYAYKTRLMNDVHMSHAMEFEYPQSMANCATCHEGKLDLIFTDANFVIETCKSCHPVTGSPQAEKDIPALADIVPHTLTGRDNCFGCHAGGFSAVTGHTGYDKTIYADAVGTKYSSQIVVTIGSASFDNNVLSFAFSAAGTAGGLNAADITPTVLVGLYGYDTKDFIIGPHETTNGLRNLEYSADNTVTNNSPYITLTEVAAGSWQATADLSAWAGIIDNGAVKRVEIAVEPALLNADGVMVALNAPSKTFDLTANAFVNFYPAIVKVPAGCNNCHDALATTFHTPDRGGNIVVCRMCHITKSGASHLEMQSRSIDSYVHSIHSFQPFDYGRSLSRGGTDFDNAVQVMYLDLVAESTYPVFGLTDCESCHVAGKFNVPDQAKSLPGIFSASWSGNGDNPTFTSTIKDVPAWVAGPASRACGACHRAELIKENLLGENMAGALGTFNQHTQSGGYLLTPAAVSNLFDAINVLSPIFYDGILVTP